MAYYDETSASAIQSKTLKEIGRRNGMSTGHSFYNDICWLLTQIERPARGVTPRNDDVQVVFNEYDAKRLLIILKEYKERHWKESQDPCFKLAEDIAEQLQSIGVTEDE